MQHNVHAARPAPHIRAAHHHSHSHSHAHMHLHPGMEQHLGPSLQQQQPPQQPPHRDHLHARLNHHHLHAQQQQTPSNQATAVAAAGAAYHHGNINSNSSNNISSNNNQMQKIRQQHQHLSGSNGILGNQPPGPPPQGFNPLAGNPAALAYNQLPPHPSHHMAAHLGSYAAPPPHYYMSQAKPSKYNQYANNANSNTGSNNNANNYTPKAILQNTYRNQKVVVPALVQEVNSVAEPQVSTTTATTNNSSNTTNNTVKASDPANQENASQEQESAEEPVSLADDCSSTEHIDASGTLPNEDTMSSGRGGGKDKTPMCLVNELARYNKISHQYRLTGERGPAHCKTFTVTLMLGDEEYSADGFKIKKAQHLAASKAIEDTTYKHPPPKIRRSDDGPLRTHITPTVELNALAMKLGQRTFYLLDPTQIPPSDSMVPPEFAGAHLLTAPGPGMPQQPPPPPYGMRQRLGNGFVPIPSPPMHPHFYHGSGQRPFPPKFISRFAIPPPLGGHVHHGPNGPFPPVPTPPSKITLFVGKQKFVGVGRTLQQAKHDAAARALQVLKTQAISASDEALEDSIDEGDKKSPISQVHEIGIKRNMTVHFKVLREEGPAHMKNFITACIVGSIVTEGEGNGKKVSKKRAAEKMLTELQKLPPLTPTKQTPLKRIKVKTPGKNGASTREGSVVPGIEGPAQMGKPERRKRLNPPKEKMVDLDDADNPITKLIQLQQTRKEKEPIFELIAKNGNETARRREFVMEVSASGSTARGTGNSKKLAKRNAAQALFELLEAVEFNPSNETQSSEESSTSATMSAVTAPAVEATAESEVPMVSTPVGPMPGILILRQNKKPAKKRDQVVVVKANVDTKEDETSKAVIVAAEENNTTNGSSGDTSNTSSGDSQATEVASESALNTSTGSNTSGVSSNSSNVGGNTDNSNSNPADSRSSSGSNTVNSNSSTESSNNSTSNTTQSAGVHMKEQLLYLSKLLDFEVNFSDYPKGNHKEFLTIVTLSTNPPQICHGVGKSSDESQNDAASNALKILSKLGLNNAMK
ncbi:LOW QUALITY PROTEIN: maternal effect protein staufen [Drosophila eugracilis]|uniref:LOW QUALITY PROTEIN: maternal effect protein staufen n=1 Tax=Drosophila eugracilis TaxID=29029 RepID=UPI001BD9559C|nr:LOW QUALITY PROTEIN: maternal effect protein staufen [Drosophila eugracilis]